MNIIEKEKENDEKEAWDCREKEGVTYVKRETEEAEVKLVNQSCSKELGGCILLPHPLQVV